jgi:anti-anti-sigma regulatory factor
MLKISFSETPMEEKWILEGRLSGVWARELKASWKKNHQTDKKRACIVDLNEVKFIDKTGEGLLRVLRDEGAQFLLGGCNA